MDPIVYYIYNKYIKKGKRRRLRRDGKIGSLLLIIASGLKNKYIKRRIY